MRSLLKKDNESNSTTLYCFSPPVMLATLTTEIILTGYTFWRYKIDQLTRLTIITLVCLATFQLAEFNVCTGYGLHAEDWSRLGFVMITALPALGINILSVLSGKDLKKLIYTAYATMAGFIVFFLTYRAAFIGHQCTGNYVIFQLGQNVGGAYGIYYYGWLFIGIYLAVHFANQFKELGKSEKIKMESMRAMLVGYLVFLVPTALAMTIKPQYRQGIPSIMCGFAVIFALILTFYVLPRNAHINNENRFRLKNS